MQNLHKSRRTAHRVVSVFVFVFMFAATVNAYTIVMRGGRRVEIPSQFIVTASTLTYEAAPGFQITLQIATIDIPATERANNEQPGSLMRRTQLTPEPSDSSQSLGESTVAQEPARRTITNRDLESTMRRRRESELAYENRRKQLGLPSVAESRRQAAAEAEAIGFELEQRRAAKDESEAYWRGRATDLRTEIAALDAEIGWIRARLDDGPSNGWTNGSATSFTSVIPYMSFRDFGRRSYGNFGGAGYHRARSRGQGVFVAPGQDSRATGRGAFGRGARRGHGRSNNRALEYALQRGIGALYPGIGSGYPVFPGVDFGSTSAADDYSYERNALVTDFNELAAARAGLNARWRVLEEEARRAGVPPGWLRP